ncbi:MAG: phage holin family protein [Petrimonas sp.]|uniref:phage holin family protein n=1 Tax=Petrimonas sp. TaxID=2023866 RepID=UPI002B373A4A|nr:phage holin family protein [Petrimonas sp.]MEA5045040.1 phage holin family protein [Petrimonas sp.]MEA5063320.1 phage holin family protein [Petrimonas sp.]
MEDKTVTGLFEEMKSDVTSYVTNTIEIVKLEAFEKASKGTASAAITLFLACFVFLILALALLTLGFYLADVFDSNWKGFGIVTLGAIALTLVLLLIKKPLKNSIINSVIKFLQRQEDEEVKYTTKS